MRLPLFCFVLQPRLSMIALMSDSKYGYRFVDNSISLGLIRGSYEPDPTPEIERLPSALRGVN